MDQLLTDRANQGGGGQSLKQQLRSLFTTMEINLVSDRVPLTERERQNGAVELPQDCFVDSRLVGKREAISVPLTLYKEALTQVGSRIAPGETPGLVETHHAFLVPARSYGDNQMIETLMQQGMLDEELVADVLAVDFATPVFSPAPASLMRSEEHHKSQCTSLVQPIRAWCTLYNAFFSELHTSIVYVQRVAKPPLPASITWTALPAGRPIRGKEV